MFDTKTWWQSRTIWLQLVAVLFAVLFAVQHDERVALRDAPHGIALDQVERQVRGPQRMRLREGVFLAQVDERDLVAGEQVPSDVGEGEGRKGHALRSSAERSQRLGSRVFE